MRSILFCVVFLTTGVLLKDQVDLKNYSGLLSEGKMPNTIEEVFNSASDKEEEALILKYMFQSGRIVYGTALNQYLDNIVNHLLADNPQLRNQITVFIDRSPTVNASATPQGYIFVNVGLLAQATNEAEIAFVLAHEIVHIADKHSVIKLEKNQNLNHYLSRHNRSREQENDADRYALQRYFAASKYSYNAVDGAFDILQYGYLPFDNIPFKRSAVETNFYAFDDKYYLENIKPIRSREDYIDTLSTHPNLLKRRTAAKNICETKNNEGRFDFVQDKALFEQIQTIARYECIHQYLIDHDYGRAYYNAYLVRQNRPDTWLQNAMAIAIYGMSKHKQEGSLREILPRHSTKEGESQQIYFFFGEISRAELNVLAVRSLWQAYKKDSTNKLLFYMCADAVRDMIEKNKLDLNDFSDYPAGTEVTEDATVPSADTVSQNTAQNKYDRIKKTTKLKVKPSERFKTINYMLVDMKNDDDFISLVYQTKDKIEDDEIMDIVHLGNTKGIGNSGILILEPSYSFVKDDEFNFRKAMTGRKALSSTIKSSVNKLKMNTTFIEKEQMGTFTTAEYNRYCRIIDWLNDMYGIEKTMIFYQSEEMKYIADELNCKYMALVRVTAEPGRFLSFNKFQDLAFALVCPVVAPAYLSKFFLMRYHTTISVVVFEIETGKSFFSSQNTIRNTTSQKALVNAYVYDYMYKIKNGGKK
jgi:Zn-dependent protease with chaperone function